jgi:hypothetical protein
MGIKALILAALLLATPAMAREEVSSFQEMDDFVLDESMIIGECPDGRSVSVSYYSNPYDPFTVIHLVYVGPDFDNYVVQTFVSTGDGVPEYDIYVSEATTIGWYKTPDEFLEDYPEGLCGVRRDQNPA